jgi:hypothetical protein
VRLELGVEVKRGLGYRPDPAGHRKTAFRHLAARLGVVTPPPYAMLATPAVLDQGPTSSCTGHATACGLKTALGAELPWVPSPRGIYTLARCIDRFDPSFPLADEGAEPNQVIRAIAEWGIRAMQGPTADGRNSDCSSALINDEPSLFELEEDAARVAIGAYAITSSGFTRLRELAMALSSGKPVLAAIAASGDVFQGYTEGVLGSLGSELDHYICLYGYRTVGTAMQVRGRNSWGVEWGEAGNFWLGEAGIAELGDLFVLDVTLGGLS